MDSVFEPRVDERVETQSGTARFPQFPWTAQSQGPAEDESLAVSEAFESVNEESRASSRLSPIRKSENLARWPAGSRPGDVDEIDPAAAQRLQQCALAVDIVDLLVSGAREIGGTRVHSVHLYALDAPVEEGRETIVLLIRLHEPAPEDNKLYVRLTEHLTSFLNPEVARLLAVSIDYDQGS